MLRLPKRDSGQALLIVLLTMAVILTVVLSVTARSVVDISTTSTSEDSLRAFSAAEAGVEQVLLNETSATVTIDAGNNVGFVANLTRPLPGDEIIYTEPVDSGEFATFWFVSHNENTLKLDCSTGYCATVNQIRDLCWGEATPNGQPNTPAVELSIYYDPAAEAGTLQAGVTDGDFSQLRVVRATYDAHTARSATNHFNSIDASYSTTSPCVIGNRKFPFFVKNISVTSLGIRPQCWTYPGCLLMARVRLLYNTEGQSVGMNFQTTGGSRMPAQGFMVESRGTALDTVRSLNVFRSYPAPASVFDSAVFSGSSI